MQHFEKLRLALRYYLLGKEYYVALSALDYGAQYHTGVRKNGITPEYQQTDCANNNGNLITYLLDNTPSSAPGQEISL